MHFIEIVKVNYLLKIDDFEECIDTFRLSFLRGTEKKIARDWSFVDKNASTELHEIGLQTNNDKNSQ